MGRYLLGIDNGGTDVKCGIYSDRGEELYVSAKNVATEIGKSGEVERDSEELWKANVSVIADAVKKSGIDPADIAAVGVTGYGNGMCLLDGAGSASYPAIVSTDTRASTIIDKWRKTGKTEAVMQKTRQDMFASQPPALIAWFKENAPEVLDRSVYALQVKDYVRYRLTGEIALEYTDMSNTACIDVDNCTLAESVFDILDIAEYKRLFPQRILHACDVAGYISFEASESTGLPAGIPVVSGFFDIDACCLASGVLSSDTLCIVGGTWLINEYLTDEIDQGIGKMATTLSFIPGKYLISDSSATGVCNFNWFIENIAAAKFPGLSGKELYDVCNASVESAYRKESDIVFVPYIYASATSCRSAGAFLGIRASDDFERMLRAVYEGILFSSIHHIDRLRKNREDFRTIRLSGGLSNSEVWCQMFADALNISVEIPSVSNHGTMGAALCAGVGIKVWDSFEEAVNDTVKIRRKYEPDLNRHTYYMQKYANYIGAVSSVDFYSSI